MTRAPVLKIIMDEDTKPAEAEELVDIVSVILTGLGITAVQFLGWEVVEEGSTDV